MTNCGLGFIDTWAVFVIVLLRERARFVFYLRLSVLLGIFEIYFEFYILQIGQIEIEYNWL